MTKYAASAEYGYLQVAMHLCRFRVSIYKVQNIL